MTTKDSLGCLLLFRCIIIHSAKAHHMNADNYYAIGSTHKVCQDYALSYTDSSESYIILSDGCSSSSDTDVGARILANLFKNSFTHPASNIIVARGIVETMGLNMNCLDATLLFARYNAERHTCSIAMYGDGVIALINKDGSIEVTVDEFDSGAPNYLSYLGDPNRYALYCEQFGLSKKTTSFVLNRTETGYIVGNQTIKASPNGLAYADVIDTNKYSAVAIMSDGANSFYRTVETGTSRYNEDVSLSSVLMKVLDLKNTNGEFVKRKMNAFHKDMDRLNWKHADDFSLAAISFAS